MFLPTRSIYFTTKQSKTCVVCGETSTRVKCHYERLLCYGCRNFVKRVVQKRVAIVPCQFGGKCPTNQNNRRFCRDCRYQKCLREKVAIEKVQAYTSLSDTEKAAIAQGEAPIQYRERKTPPATHFQPGYGPLFGTEYSNFTPTGFFVPSPSACTTPSHPPQAYSSPHYLAPHYLTPPYLTPPYYTSSLAYHTNVYPSGSSNDAYHEQGLIPSPVTPSSMDLLSGVFPALHKAINPQSTVPFSESTPLSSLPGNSEFTTSYHSSPVDPHSPNVSPNSPDMSLYTSTPRNPHSPYVSPNSPDMSLYTSTPRNRFTSEYNCTSSSDASAFSLHQKLANQTDLYSPVSLPDHSTDSVYSADVKGETGHVTPNRMTSQLSDHTHDIHSGVSQSQASRLSPRLTPQQSHTEIPSGESAELFKSDSRKRHLGFNIDDLLFGDSTESQHITNPSKKVKLDYSHYNNTTSQRLVVPSSTWSHDVDDDVGDDASVNDVKFTDRALTDLLNTFQSSPGGQEVTSTQTDHIHRPYLLNNPILAELLS